MSECQDDKYSGSTVYLKHWFLIIFDVTAPGTIRKFLLGPVTPLHPRQLCRADETACYTSEFHA